MIFTNRNGCDHLKTVAPGDAFAFGTKAENLANLRACLTHAEMVDQAWFDVGSWQSGGGAQVEKILDMFSGQHLAVRSSSQNEDNESGSLAGAYHSQINVPSESNAISTAISKVIDSYGDAAIDDQILVQPMVRDTVISGVALSRDLNTGSPYYVVNYDDFSGRTDHVTSGKESKCILIHRSRPESIHSERFRHLIDAMVELERATDRNELDVEFCIDSTDTVYILQVRPLAASNQWRKISDEKIDIAIETSRAELTASFKPHPDCFGETTLFGDMPDWNPAEMIGTSPRPLAFSLYRELITDKVWSQARREMGYLNQKDQPLLVSISGKPFVDVRLSLNSFLPDGIDRNVAQRLINVQLDMLENNRQWHDKIEFEIALTCFDFDIERQKSRLLDNGASPDDLDHVIELLHALTNKIVSSGKRDISDRLLQTEQLASSDHDSHSVSPIEHAKDLLQSCALNGTLPFSVLARHGFIAVSLLRSMTSRGIIESDSMDAIMRGIETIASQLVHDMHGVISGTKDRDEFLMRFGHLRPGTYDILSPRYDEQPNLYLGASEKTFHHRPFQLSKKEELSLAQALNEIGFEIKPADLLSYIEEAIKARELAKFRFTRNLSNALSSLQEWGRDVGFTREDVAFLRFDQIFGNDDTQKLREDISRAREEYAITQAIRLPNLISSPDDLDVIRLPLGHPTFITHETVTSGVRRLSGNSETDLKDKILLIEGADPGYDWIFSHGVAGLVTKYGGANSHMAIRCAEFGLPAAIGCGERLYSEVESATLIELDCATHSIRKVR